jgi:hypothetical protein
MRKRWGIISGCSGVTRLPVAARILAVKRDDTVNIAEISVGEHDENPDLSQIDLNLICNNIKGSPVVAEQEDWILTVAAVIPE